MRDNEEFSTLCNRQCENIVVIFPHQYFINISSAFGSSALIRIESHRLREIRKRFAASTRAAEHTLSGDLRRAISSMIYRDCVSALSHHRYTAET